MELIELDKKIKDLLEISNSIHVIYENLFEAEIINDSVKYNTYIEHLKTCIEVENDIYHSLNIDNINILQIKNRILYLNSKFKFKNEILERVINQIYYIVYVNPFLSSASSLIDYNQENINTIANQFYIEYDFKVEGTTINEINLNKNLSQGLKADLIFDKNYISFANKSIENVILNKGKIDYDGKERCILFGHDSNTIDVVYEDMTHLYISNILNDIFNITDLDLKNDMNEAYNQYKYLLELKACFSIGSNNSIKRNIDLAKKIIISNFEANKELYQNSYYNVVNLISNLEDNKIKKYC